MHQDGSAPYFPYNLGYFDGNLNILQWVKNKNKMLTKKLGKSKSM
jgi:hypothetical protein